jgi:hypothetical protein
VETEGTEGEGDVGKEEAKAVGEEWQTRNRCEAAVEGQKSKAFSAWIRCCPALN